jgi:hypothetical protein
MGGHQRSPTVQKNRRLLAFWLTQLKCRRAIQIVVPKVGGLTVGDAVLLPRWQPAAHIPHVAHGVHLRSRDQT